MDEAGVLCRIFRISFMQALENNGFHCSRFFGVWILLKLY